MIRNGLYRVGFETRLGAGAGIAVLQDGNIRGGDSMMYYIGTYKVSGSLFCANIVTGAHTKVFGMASVFGRDVVHLQIEGEMSGDAATGKLRGRARETPEVEFSATLSKLPELQSGL